LIGMIDSSTPPRELAPGTTAGSAEQISTLFSPSGDAIFYTRRVRGGVVTIWRVDVSGANARPITDAEPGLQLRSVSPDGKWISVNRNGRTPREAWIFQADGGQGRKLWNGWGFAWTPENRGFLLTAGGMVSSAWVLPNRANALVPDDLGENPTEDTFKSAGGQSVLTEYFFIEPTPMPPPFTIAYSKVVNHSNLYQLALPR